MGWLDRIFFRRGKDDQAFVEQVEHPARRTAAAVPSNLPRFHSTANESAAAPRGEGRRSARARLRVAFTPSQPVSDVRMFAGRSDMLLSLIRAIEDQQLHVILYGDRGMGKTSLLHVLGNLAREARYHVHYTSCSESSSFSSTFHAIANALPIMYHSDYGPTSAEAERGESMAALLPQQDATVADVSDVFAHISGTRVLIILDEFDRSRSADFQRSIAELIKTLSDRSARVQLVIAGVAPNLATLIEHIPSIRRNILGIAVGKLTDEEVGQLLENGERTSGIEFDDDARQAIIIAANGSPYLAGLLGQQAGISASDRDALMVEQSDVGVALERATGEVRQRLSQRSLAVVDRAVEERRLPAMVNAARSALDNCGQVAAASVDRVLLSAGGESPGLLGGILAPAEHGFDGYRFAEETVALYIWLLGVQRSMRQPPALATVQIPS